MAFSSSENATLIPDNSILLQSPVKHIEWNIQNIADQPIDGDYTLDSASVYFCGVKWFIRICTNGEKRTKSSGWISLYLVRKKSSEEHRVSFKIGIIKPDKSEFKTVDYEHTFESTKESGWGNPKVIDRNTLLSSKCDVVSDGTLTVFCTFRIMDKLMPSTTVESEAQTIPDAASTLIQDLEDLCLKSYQADLTITVKGKEFRGHKSILSCRSSVFKTDMEKVSESVKISDGDPDYKSIEISDGDRDSKSVEISNGDPDSKFVKISVSDGDPDSKSVKIAISDGDTNSKSVKISISDGDPDTFQDFLLFLYTGKVDIVSSRNAVSLYRYADRYNVQDLKKECVHCMLFKLSDDIFCDVFYLASEQRELDLLKSVTKYFIKNTRSIAISEQWRKFIKNHPVLCNELYVNALHSDDNAKK